MILADQKTRANGDSMRKAAMSLGVDIPKTRGGKSDQELLGNLRLELSKRLAKLPVDEHVKCVVCAEVATEDTAFCPFCGDEGTPEVVAAVVPAAAPAVGVGITKTPVPTAPNVELATEALAKDLDERLAKITQLKRNAVGMSYDIGIECREIRDRQLFKARGYTSFAQFAKEELPFTRESALQLISIVENHSREDYGKIGYAKLRVISAVSDSSVKTELMDAARKGGKEGTTKAIQERANRASSTPKKTPPPEAGERITLIGKIGARNQVVKFHDVASGEIVESAGTFKSYQESIYGELEVAGGVFVRIGLRVTQAKALEGLTVRFVRASDSAE